MAISKALRRSMMEMASHRRTADPIFWAPFVLVGDGVSPRRIDTCTVTKLMCTTQYTS